MRIFLCLFLCFFSVACVAKPIMPPETASAGRLGFVAWYTTNSLEVPLQGVLLLTQDARLGWRAERMGLALTQGRTVGVCQWSIEGVSRQTSDMPGAERLLLAVERAVTTLARLRGITVLGEVSFPDCSMLDQDARGPQELFCSEPSMQVTVRVTGDQR